MKRIIRFKIGKKTYILLGPNRNIKDHFRHIVCLQNYKKINPKCCICTKHKCSKRINISINIHENNLMIISGGGSCTSCYSTD